MTNVYEDMVNGQGWGGGYSNCNSLGAKTGLDHVLDGQALPQLAERA